MLPTKGMLILPPRLIVGTTPRRPDKSPERGRQTRLKGTVPF